MGGLALAGLTLLTAVCGALASVNAPVLYAALQRPDWAPPASVFGPVWSVLYLLMIVAAWLVWQHRGQSGVGFALGLYVLALVPNGLWSWLFFGWQQGLVALMDVAVLWVLVGLSVRAFWRVRPLAGALLLPLWCWVSFAAVLNAQVWRANPQLLGGGA